MDLSSVLSIENVFTLFVFAVIIVVALAFADNDRKRR